MSIRLKRVYEPPATSDGFRILVERLWPRGVSKEHAHIDLWLKDAGASTELRSWFGHEPEKWDEFQKRYFDEIRHRPPVVKTLRDIIQEKGTVTFVYAARDTQHNNAVALKAFLEKEERVE
jgi:uncharacterized protein YeaO (DUF488 family)